MNLVSRGRTRGTVNKIFLITVLILGLSGAARAGSRAAAVVDFGWSVRAGDVTAVMAHLRKAPRLLGLKDKAGQTPLHWAAEYGQVDMVRFLLARGLGVNARNRWGCTPLCLAAKFGRPEVAKVLVNNGATPDLATTQGLTPLHYAAYYGHSVVAVILLRGRARASVRDKQGRTPLDLAARRGHQSVIEVIRQFGGGR
jgi:ankyrin repeat protein